MFTLVNSKLAAPRPVLTFQTARRWWRGSAWLLLAAAPAVFAAEAPTTFLRVSEPPPTPPGMLVRPASALSPESLEHAAAPTLYSIGNPTDEEQFYLEYINRARANPAAEALRLKNTTDSEVLQSYSQYAVDLNLMASQISALPAAPPLAMNAKLTAAARIHSQDMFANQYQAHNGSDGSTPSSRVDAQGYNWRAVGESIFAYATSVDYGFAAFEVDWGGTPATGGMQSPPGHRINNHNLTYREVGVGVVLGSNGTVGPQLVTQDFASLQGDKPFITGVAYYDLNGNGFFDAGEGIGGVTVTVVGASYYAVTAATGGYAVPVPGNGNYAVTFSAPGFTDQQVNVVVANLQNLKTDFIPTYAPPAVSGPDPASAGLNNAYQFTAVGGASSYRWRRSERVASTAVEGAENGLANVTAVTTPGYTVINSAVHAGGTHSFHLAQPQPDPQSAPVTQYLVLQRAFRPAANGQLAFQSRLGWATDKQVARAQISTDAGRTWQTLWSQAGNNAGGETSFHAHAASLAAFVGAEIAVRFVYDLVDPSGGFFSQTDNVTGLFLDDIAVTGAEELINRVESDVAAGTSFNFNPAAAGNYALDVRPTISGRSFDWGPAKLVAAQLSSTPNISLSNPQLGGAGQVQINFALVSGTAANFVLLSAPAVTGPFTPDAGASIQSLGAGQYRATTTAPGVAHRFYRVSAQ